MGCRVNFQDIDMLPRRNCATIFTLSTRLGRWPIGGQAIQSLGQNTCRTGFPSTANSGKNIRMRNASGFNRSGQSFNQNILADK